MITYCFGKPILIDGLDYIAKFNEYKNYIKYLLGDGTNKTSNIYNDPDKVWVACNFDYYQKLSEVIKKEIGCEVKKNGKEIIFNAKVGNEEIALHTDQMGFSAIGNNSHDIKYPYFKYINMDSKKLIDKDIDYIINLTAKTRTIGGSFIFPTAIWNYYNKVRGVRSYIEDRADLTLNEIKQCIEYVNLESEGDKKEYIKKHKYNILLNYYIKDDGKPEFKKIFEMWFGLFGGFADYIKIFKFDDFVCKGKVINIYESDIKNNRILLLPDDQDDYINNIVGNRNCIKIIQKNALKNDLERLLNNIGILITNRTKKMKI